MRVERPPGAWTARFASPIYDPPAGLAWDTEGLLVAAYGFVAYALEAGPARCAGHIGPDAAGGPARVAAAGHVIVQSEIETFAIERREVAWRVAHSDVVTGAELRRRPARPESFGGQSSVARPGDRPQAD